VRQQNLTAPQNLDAEESVLGAILRSPHVIANIADKVRAEDFYRDSHGQIFRTALELDAEGEPVDALTLCDKLEEKGILGNVGGKVRIHELAALMPSVANAARYADIVREQSQLRKLIAAGQKIESVAWERNGEISELQMRAEQILQEAVETVQGGDITRATDGFGDTLRSIRTAVQLGKPIFGLSTGFPDFDAMTLGLRGGQVITVAARPGFGKSVWGMNIAYNVAERGEPAAIFTLEMSKEELVFRLLSRMTEIDGRRIRAAKLSAEELSQVIQASKKLHQMPLYIEDSAMLNTTEVRARTRRMRKKHGCEIVCVDYLQLMAPEGTADKRNEQVSLMSRNLKLMAKELDIPIIQISQLNRNVDAREDHKPVLSDLRESGSIEQDSDIVIFIYREGMYKPVANDKMPDAEFIVAKHRGGETGTFKLLFHARKQMFLTPAKGEKK
jgi:replicative DNA helicase